VLNVVGSSDVVIEDGSVVVEDGSDEVEVGVEVEVDIVVEVVGGGDSLKVVPPSRPICSPT
jgi:hypothetical protein